MRKHSKKIMQEILEQSDIQINGSRDWDIQIHNEKLYRRILRDRELGLGESYMEGWWDVAHIDEFCYRLVTANIENIVIKNRHFLLGSIAAIIRYLRYALVNQQTKHRSIKIGKHHYDIGNNLYLKMLDTRMNYTCGYWQAANDLESAQEAKLDLICKKLNLQPGQKILDIGCGWGSFVKYAAENYGVSAVGITISQQQIELGQQLCAGLPIEIRFQDYRELNEQFDHIISIGMFEHVGHKNYRKYLQIVRNCLADEGLFLLHTIGTNESTVHANKWTSRYIFPHSMLPSMKQITSACESTFVIEDIHNFGADYDKTLLAWHENFNAHWDELKNHYDDRFYRMWNYYLLSAASAFRARRDQLWQFVLSKEGVPGGYQTVR